MQRIFNVSYIAGYKLGREQEYRGLLPFIWYGEGDKGEEDE